MNRVFKGFIRQRVVVALALAEPERFEGGEDEGGDVGTARLEVGAEWLARDCYESFEELCACEVKGVEFWFGFC